jgi:D-arabinose 1-dehydrogenase-like Zn-dependent alcohol dehydrogenase
LAAEDAAQLLCAGITTFNALRNSGVRPGDLVAVLGIGGLGHLAVQFAAKMGAHTVAVARGIDKEPLARKLGAHRYIDSNTQDVAGELNKLGGARVVLATVTNAKAMAKAIGGLAVDGKLIVDRFLGYHGVQRIGRYPADDRDHAARTGIASL